MLDADVFGKLVKAVFTKPGNSIPFFAGRRVDLAGLKAVAVAGMDNTLAVDANLVMVGALQAYTVKGLVVCLRF
jgi:hypothetical protein